MAKQIAFPKVSANNIGGNMQGLAFAKSAMTTGAAPQKLDLEGKRAIESIKDHNARVVEDPGAGIVTRSITLGDLWTAGKGGVPLMDVRDAEWIHMPPHPSAVSLEIFVNGGAGDLEINNTTLVVAHGFLLTPGGSIRVPKANYVTVRPVADGSTAFRKVSSARLLQEVDGGGGLGSPGHTSPTDARFLDKSQQFPLLFSKDFLAPQQPKTPESLSVAALAGTVGDDERAAVDADFLTGTITLNNPWDVIPLEIVRRYAYMALVLTQAADVDGGGGADVRPSSFSTTNVNILPAWAVDYLGHMFFGSRLNAAVSSRGCRMVLPLVGDTATHGSSLFAHSNANNGTLTLRNSALCAQWLLSKTPIDFDLAVNVQEVAAAAEYTTIYAGPLKESGKLLVNVKAGELTVNVYAYPEDGDLSAIATTPAIPVRTEYIAAGPGSISVDVPGGGNVAVVALAGAAGATFLASMTGK